MTKRLLGEYLTEDEESQVVDFLRNTPDDLWGIFLESDLAITTIDKRIAELDTIYRNATILSEAMLQSGFNVSKSQIEKMWDHGWGNFDPEYLPVILKFIELGGDTEEHTEGYGTNKTTVPAISPNARHQLLEMIKPKDEITRKLLNEIGSLHKGRTGEHIRITEHAHSDDHIAPATDNCEQALRDAYEEVIIATKLCGEAIQRKAQALQHLRQIDQMSEFTFESYYPDGKPRSSGIWGNFLGNTHHHGETKLIHRTKTSNKQGDCLQHECRIANLTRVLQDHQGTIIRSNKSRAEGEQIDHRGSITFENRIRWPSDETPPAVYPPEELDKSRERITEILEDKD